MKKIILVTTLILATLSAKEEIKLVFGKNMKTQNEKAIQGCRQPDILKDLKDGNKTKPTCK